MRSGWRNGRGVSLVAGDPAWTEGCLPSCEHSSEGIVAGGLAAALRSVRRLAAGRGPAGAAAASAAGFAPGPAGLPVISVGQSGERRQRLGVLPFWLFFVGRGWQRVCMGGSVGQAVILDATAQAVWVQDDPDAAWRFPNPGQGSTWGYKGHTLRRRGSDWPLLVLGTPALPLRVLAVVCFGLTLTIVRADAGYFTYPMLQFIRTVLHASFMLDDNWRRRGKRFLATRFFCSPWHFHLRPHTAIERRFARAKRSCGLERAQGSGLTPAYQPPALVYATMLAVALLAHRFQRPELALSRSHVLALKPLA